MRPRLYHLVLATLLFLFVIVGTASGQNYNMTTSAGNSIVPGTSLVPGTQADDAVANVALPFPYTVYGTVFNSVNVSTNGNMQFSTSDNWWVNECPMPILTNFGRTFLIHWDDMLLTAGGNGIFTSVSGTAPNRIFNIEWRAAYFSGGGTANFEARLYEGQQRVDFIYGAVGQNGTSATIGVQREPSPTTFFTQFSCNTSSITSGLGVHFVIPPPLTPCAPTLAQVFTQSTPTAIPTGPAVVTSTLLVTGAPSYLYDLNLTTFLTHTFAADLDITIQSPGGTIVTLTTDNGGGSDNVFNGTVWDDDANPAGQVP